VKIEKENLKEWLSVVENASKGSHYPALYKKIYQHLRAPSRSRGAVSISKLNSCTKEGDNVIVPRKVLSKGKMEHKVSISALEYSQSALSSLKGSGCSIVKIKDMTTKNRISLIV
jgi:large subunit ribosomal protein L18e